MINKFEIFFLEIIDFLVWFLIDAEKIKNLLGYKTYP